MDNINQEWYPDKNYLNNIKKGNRPNIGQQ